jgi:hypothetical protein
MKITRYTDTASVDYMLLADDGDWMPASEGLALQAENAELRRLLATRVEASRLDEANAEIARLTSELQKERDRRVEHRQMNQILNEHIQETGEIPEEPPEPS